MLSSIYQSSSLATASKPIFQLLVEYKNFSWQKKKQTRRGKKSTENVYLTSEFNLGGQWPEQNIQVFSMYMKANSCFIYLALISYFKQMTDMLLYIIDLADTKWETTNWLLGYWTFLLLTNSSLSASGQCQCKHTIFWVIWRREN